MVARTVRRLGRADALFLISGIWFLGKFLRYAFPPLFSELQSVYGVSNATTGAAFTGFMIVYATMQFPSGVLADAIGSVRVIAGGAVLASAGALAVTLGSLDVPQADSFLLLVGAMLVMGAGTGAHKTVAIGLLSLIYRSTPGRALGVFDTVGTFGGVAAPAAVAVLLSGGLQIGVGGKLAAILLRDWRGLFLAGGVAGLLLAGGLLLRVPRRVPDGPTEPGDTVDRSPELSRYVAPFRSPRFSAFVVVTVCFSIAYNGITAFLPLFLVRAIGTGQSAARLLYGTLFAVSVAQLVTGELSDRIGRLPVIVGTLALAASALAVLLFAPSGPAFAGVPIVTALAVVGIGLGSHGFRPVRGRHLTALLPEAIAGGGLGVVRTALMGAGALAPAAVGVIADAAGFRVAFGGLLAALCVGVGVAAALWLTGEETA